METWQLIIALMTFWVSLSYHFSNSGHVVPFIRPSKENGYVTHDSSDNWHLLCVEELMHGMVTHTINLICHWTWVCYTCPWSWNYHLLSDVKWLSFLVFIMLTYLSFQYILLHVYIFWYFQLEWFKTMVKFLLAFRLYSPKKLLLHRQLLKYMYDQYEHIISWNTQYTIFIPCNEITAKVWP